MNVTESLARILRFERPAEIVQFEWGYWDETISRWKDEGMPGENPWEALGTTYYFRAPVRARLWPPFARKVIRERLDPDDPGRLPQDWKEQAGRLNNRDAILVMGGIEISFFGWHRDLLGVEKLLRAYYEEPRLIHAISRHHLGFLKRLYSRVLEDVSFDFIFVWEDMCYKNGPLISPAMVREFMLPYYREMVDFFRQFGDYKFLLDTDGDCRKLIPLFRETGIDGLLPFEVAAGMNIVDIAREYPDLIIAGGIDKREIARGKEAIDRELETKLPPLFRRGGYLPTLDHHVPPEVSYKDFRYYVEKTRQLYRRYGC